MAEFHAVPTVPLEELEANTAHALTLGLPAIEYAGHVAVVGGGPSLADHLDELRAWEGPIWAINATWRWLKERGIKSTFFTCDPKLQPWLRLDRGEAALVSISLCPEMFEALAGGNIRTFTLGLDDVHCTFTTATSAPHMALKMGHRSVTFFGCDASFTGAQAYAFDHPLPGDLIVVEVAGEGFATKPEFLMQAKDLAELCRELPDQCRSRSAGLMAALIACPEYKIVGITPPRTEPA